MKFGLYIKDKLGIIGGYAGFVIFTYLLMMAFHSQLQMRIMFVIVAVIFVVSVIAFDYLRKYKFYNSLVGHLDELDQKYLILDTLDEPDFYEGKLVYSAMYDINKSMTENVRKYRDSVEDFKDFIEIWVHEIKLPIASLVLMCHNNRDVIPRKYEEQVARLDAYADQVLYYVRAEHASADYRFAETNLKSVIGRVAVKNKDVLLDGDISLNVHDVDECVVTDSKWLEFMVNQIVSNSIKYIDRGQEKTIEIWTEPLGDGKALHIKDNGIGIPQSDIPLVCRKSFTGENGRKHAKSTGMGLYIIDNLCRQLGHKLNIASKVDEYTDVSIVFGHNDIYKIG